MNRKRKYIWLYLCKGFSIDLSIFLFCPNDMGITGENQLVFQLAKYCKYPFLVFVCLSYVLFSIFHKKCWFPNCRRSEIRDQPKHCYKSSFIAAWVLSKWSQAHETLYPMYLFLCLSYSLSVCQEQLLFSSISSQVSKLFTLNTGSTWTSVIPLIEAVLLQ